jgi:hypothetical protein
MLSSRPIERRPTLAPAAGEDAAAALRVVAMGHDEVITRATDIEWMRQIRADRLGSYAERHLSIARRPAA